MLENDKIKNKNRIAHSSFWMNMYNWNHAYLFLFFWPNHVIFQKSADNFEIEQKTSSIFGLGCSR